MGQYQPALKTLMTEIKLSTVVDYCENWTRYSTTSLKNAPSGHILHLWMILFFTASIIHRLLLVTPFASAGTIISLSHSLMLSKGCPVHWLNEIPSTLCRRHKVSLCVCPIPNQLVLNYVLGLKVTLHDTSWHYAALLDLYVVAEDVIWF